MDYAQMFSLEGKTAVVTGGATGMGAAIVEGFAAFGAEVAILSRNAANAAQVVDRVGAARLLYAL